MVMRARGEEPDGDEPIAPEELRHRKLVRRSHFLTIIAAWIITVPATALIAAGAFYALTAISE